MVHRWAFVLLLLSIGEGLRRNSRARGTYNPGFDSNGCIGWECDNLDSAQFDFVVIGSGAGGGAAAARLADSLFSVLVLEAGADAGDKLEYKMPIKHAASTETAGLAWNYFIDHYKNASKYADTKMTPKGILYPRGGALGGSTAVNAMITVLPQISDWERMASLTNDQGWGPSEMNKMEALLDEWLPKENIPLTDLLVDIFNPEIGAGALGRLVKYFDSAFEEMGQSVRDTRDDVSKFRAYANFLQFNINDRLRKGNVQGAFAFPQMIRNGERAGARERLLECINRGMDLTIKTQALVDKVVFSNARSGGGCNGPCRAKEVIYFNGKGLYGAEMNPSSATPGRSRVRVRDGGEIIISAGAFNTPQILKQSGIGPKEELDRFGIPVHVNLVGVGENLQDRYEVVVESEVFGTVPLVNRGDPLPFVNPKDCNFAAEPNDQCWKDWSSKKKGLYATNGVQLAMLARSGLTKASDLHIFGLPGPFRGYVPGYSDEIPKHSTRNRFSWAILKGHTDNRGGTVKLRCARQVGGKCVVDPQATPDINFHYFEEGVEYDELNPDQKDTKGERDLMSVVRGIELVRRINNMTDGKMTLSKTVESWPGENFAPGERFSSETERLREWVKREAWGHHASCSAPMGCIPREEVGSHNPRAGVCKSNFNANTVLDSRLRVRGTQGLRVVDASAFPRIPGTFLLLPTYMLGEKGGSMLVEEHDVW